MTLSVPSCVRLPVLHFASGVCPKYLCHFVSLFPWLLTHCSSSCDTPLSNLRHPPLLSCDNPLSSGQRGRGGFEEPRQEERSSGARFAERGAYAEGGYGGLGKGDETDRHSSQLGRPSSIPAATLAVTMPVPSALPRPQMLPPSPPPHSIPTPTDSDFAMVHLDIFWLCTKSNTGRWQ